MVWLRWLFSMRAEPMPPHPHPPRIIGLWLCRHSDTGTASSGMILLCLLGFPASHLCLAIPTHDTHTPDTHRSAECGISVYTQCVMTATAVTDQIAAIAGQLN